MINELEPGVGDAGAEFIELFNPTDCAISLGDWRLLYRSASGAAGVGSLHTFALGDDIRARTFLLLGNAKFEGQIDAELTGAMGNAGGQVGLLDDQGTVIDAVGYGVLTDAGVYTEKTPVALKADTVSIGRKKDGVDTDDNSADFKSFKAHTAGVSNQ